MSATPWGIHLEKSAPTLISTSPVISAAPSKYGAYQNSYIPQVAKPKCIWNQYANNKKYKSC